MWNEKQRSQKIAVELERLRRDLAEQERTFADLMREHFVSEEELTAAGAELAAAGVTATEEAQTEDEPTRPNFVVGAYVVRG
jgi:hypothetical protein